MNKFFIGFIAIILLVGMYTWGVYNSLVTKNEAVDQQWAQVETQYQRRFDLIPNLVESVKGVMKQEKDVFGQLAEARSKYAGANTPSQKAGAATEVESSLARLLVVMENYPALRSVETVQSLMVELAGTENRVSVERKRFNDGVADYNVYIKRVPATWLASAFNFEVKNYFKADEPAKVAPKVDFK